MNEYANQREAAIRGSIARFDAIDDTRHQSAESDSLDGKPAPRWLPVAPAAIPSVLTDEPSWYPAIIRAKARTVGKWDKIPGNPITGEPAKWSDPTTRCSFDVAFMAYQRDPRFAGIGYMMNGDAGVIGIDLDTCISPDGSIAAWARAIVDSFPGTYWEQSISGTGLRGFCRGTLSVGGCRSKVEGNSVELYADQRFLVVTGQTLAYVKTLPELQTAVDALQARLTAGRQRATGTAIGTGLTGRNLSPSAEVLALVEATMSGRHGQALNAIWLRDELHAAGASEDDWALESEIAYQAIRLGHTGAELAQLVEETMRAGPYRAKWDERRGAVTWLAQDVANAIATVLTRLGDRPILTVRPEQLVDDGPADELPPIAETVEQENARLRRELAQARATGAVQMTNLRTERIQREALTETVRAMFDVIAIPDERMDARTKLAYLVVLREAASRNSRGRVDLPNDAIEAATGLPENAVSAIMQDLPARDGSPISRRVTTVWETDSDGQRKPRRASEVWLADPSCSVAAGYRAALTMGGLSSQAQRKRANAAARTAENLRTRAEKLAADWGQCPHHDNDLVALKGFCPECLPTVETVVGERVVRREEFEILKPGFRDLTLPSPAPVSGRTTLPGFRGLSLANGSNHDRRPVLLHPAGAVSGALCRSSGRGPAPGGGAWAPESAAGRPGDGAPSPGAAERAPVSPVASPVCRADAGLARGRMAATPATGDHAARETRAAREAAGGSGRVPDDVLRPGNRGSSLGGPPADLPRLSTDELATLRAETAAAIPMARPPDPWKQPPPANLESDALAPAPASRLVVPLTDLSWRSPHRRHELPMVPTSPTPTTFSVDAWSALSPEERARIIAEAPLTDRGRRARVNTTNEMVSWAAHTWNPVTGCLHDCTYCYARDIANQQPSYPDGFAPTFWPERLYAPRHTRPPGAAEDIGHGCLFVGSMTDLFGKWVPQEWIDTVFEEIRANPQWQFLALTKFPQRLSSLVWPENAWAGTSIDRQTRVATAERVFADVDASVRWVSAEPLLERLHFEHLECFDWLVIGAASKSSQTDAFQPPREWVEHLINQAHDAGVAVYVKPNVTTVPNPPREYPTPRERSC